MEKATILLVDDHSVVRRGIRSMLDGNYIVCGEAESGDEAIEKVLELKPDLVLMDLSMPGMTGIDVTKEIRRLSPSTKVVILSVHDSSQLSDELKQFGVSACLTKTCSGDELRKTVDAVLKA